MLLCCENQTNIATSLALAVGTNTDPKVKAKLNKVRFYLRRYRRLHTICYFKNMQSWYSDF